MSVATPRSTSDDASDDGSITPTISSSPRAHEDFPPVVGRGSSSPDLRRRVGSAAFRAESAAAAASGRRPSHLKMERVPSENSVMSNESDQSSEPLTQSSFEFLAYIHEKLKSGNHDPLLWLETQAREHFFSWAYFARLLAAVVFFFVTGYINACSAAASGWRTPYAVYYEIVNSTDPAVVAALSQPSAGGPPLALDVGSPSHHLRLMTTTHAIPDVGLDLVAYVGTAVLPDSWIKDGSIDWPNGPDEFVKFHGLFLVVFLIFSPQRLKIVRRIFVVYSFVNLLRAFTVIATSLPDPTPKCHNQFHDLEGDGAYKLRPMFPEVFVRGFKVMTMSATCGDCIFSGHSTLMLLCMKAFTEYFRSSRLRCTPGRGKFVRCFMRCFTSVGLLVVLATRFHYTLDIAIAVFVNLLLWDTYHTFIRNVALRRSRDWLARLLRWFEDKEIIELEYHFHQKLRSAVGSHSAGVETPRSPDESTIGLDRRSTDLHDDDNGGDDEDDLPPDMSRNDTVGMLRRDTVGRLQAQRIRSHME